MSRHRLYGLVVDSEIELHQDRPTDEPADVTIRVGQPRSATTDAPDGRRLLHLEHSGQVLFTGTDRGATYLLRFYGTCDFVMDRDLSSIEARIVDGADLDTVGVLISGTLLSFLLALRGAPVLHGSAVQVGDAALAFVGASGMGKSTMATLLCADGARLITDDVLRLDLDTSPPRCHLGGTALRLRKAATELSALFDAAPVQRITGDRRDALTMTPSTSELLPLAGVIIPLPQHDSELARPQVTRLDAKQAALALLQFPRIVGWEDATVLDRQLQEIGDVVESVPVYVAALPWGPPFSPDLARDLTEALALDHSHR